MQKTVFFLAVFAAAAGCVAKPAPNTAPMPVPVTNPDTGEMPPCPRANLPGFDLTCDAVISFVINPLIAQRCRDPKGGFFYYCDGSGKKWRHGDSAWSCDHLCRCHDIKDNKDGQGYDPAAVNQAGRNCPRFETTAELKYGDTAVKADPANKEKDGHELRDIKPRDENTVAAKANWALVCDSNWSNDNCDVSPHFYDCDLSGGLVRRGDDERTCDNECGCADLAGGAYIPGNGNSRDIGPGQAPPPAGGT